MDFIAVLNFLLPLFEREKVDVAFIGGFALQMSGVERATKDVDFLVLADDAARIKPAMIKKGYEVVADNENVLCFIGKSPALGRVDFLLARRRYTLDMLKSARPVDLFAGKYHVKVVRPEGVIGLKVQAIANSEHRRVKDWPDIQALFRAHRGKIDLSLVRTYFKLFEMEKELDRLLLEEDRAPDA